MTNTSSTQGPGLRQNGCVGENIMALPASHLALICSSCGALLRWTGQRPVPHACDSYQVLYAVPSLPVAVDPL